MTTLIQPNVIMGLLAAFFWGGGDFSGGMGAKSTGGSLRAALRIILLSHSVSFSIVLAAALFRGDPFPHGLPLIFGVAAGVAGGLSLACFYIALARGAMGAAAAISGLLAAAIPATVAIVTTGSPGTLRLAGFLVAGVSIWLVAAAPGPTDGSPNYLSGRLSAHPSLQTMLLAVVAGAGFGVYFVALKLAGAAGVLWPMATARMGSLTTCSILLLYLGFRTPAGTREANATLGQTAIIWSLSTAVLDTCGNLLYIAATRAGRLDVAAVLASLYPATTILLAGFVLKERFTGRQVLGMVIAAAAVVMITL